MAVILESDVGNPKIAGHPITVKDVAIWHAHMGYGVAEIAAQHGLTLAQVHTALAYYYDYQQEIDRMIDAAEIREKLCEQVSSKASPRNRQKKEVKEEFAKRQKVSRKWAVIWLAALLLWFVLLVAAAVLIEHWIVPVVFLVGLLALMGFALYTALLTSCPACGAPLGLIRRRGFVPLSYCSNCGAELQ